MAVTKLWHIRGSMKDLIDYVENPEKTVLRDSKTQDFFNVFSYARNPNETADEQYVTAINCQKDVALKQMILTKKQYGKDDGYIAWHGYQSFKPGEITPDGCHTLGVMLAKEMWGDRFQVIVTTHLDRGHLHNHFAFNSVSFRDGGKYNFSPAERQRMRDASDRLCRSFGLSVIEHPHKAPSRPVWLDEQSGKPTRYNIYRDDICDAFDGSRNVQAAERYLRRLGYITDFTGKHWKIRLPQYSHFTRLDTLDEHWTPEFLRNHMGARATYGNETAVVRFSPYLPEPAHVYFTPHRKPRKIYKLYIYYCYQLGILPKHTDYRPTSPFLREELRKLDEITAQVDYMTEHSIETLDDLLSERDSLEMYLDRLVAERTRLQNQVRRASPEQKVLLREAKAKITEGITELRRDLKINKNIEKRSARMQETMDRVYDNELEADRNRTRNRRSDYER